MINRDRERVLREHIDEINLEDLVSSEISTDFYREFADRINFERLFEEMYKQYRVRALCFHKINFNDLKTFDQYMLNKHKKIYLEFKREE